MNPFLRGFSEQYIDIHLEGEEIENMKGIVDIFRMGIKSNLDAHIGFFLGYSYANLLMQHLILCNRLPDKEETIGYFNLLKRRFPEILKEIKSTKASSVLDRGDKLLSTSELEMEPVEALPE